MLNRVLLAGRMSRDPEVRFTPQNVPVCTVTLAVPRDFKPKNAESETDWVDVVLWRGAAEFVGRYGAKGRLMIVDGRLQMRKYTDKDGNKRTVAEVVADHVYFVTGRRPPTPPRSIRTTRTPIILSRATTTQKIFRSKLYPRHFGGEFL